MLELDFVGRKSIDANIYYIEYRVMLHFCSSQDSSLVELTAVTQTSRVQFPALANFLLKVRRTLGNARPMSKFLSTYAMLSLVTFPRPGHGISATRSQKSDSRLA